MSPDMDPFYFQKPLRDYFRKRRFRNFLSEYQSCRTILDCGGYCYFWHDMGRVEGITVLNIDMPSETAGIAHVRASGCEMPFPDKSFELAFSNSAIEHVGSEENQFKFAGEMARVGRKIYCQTPSRLFPIDPHMSMFFLHWLPKSWLTPKVLRYLTINGWLWKRSYDYDVTWISKRKLKKMFPGCTIETERFLFLPKSFIVRG